LAASGSESNETAKTLNSTVPNQNTQYMPIDIASPSTGGSTDAIKTNKDLFKNNLSKIAKLSKQSPNN